MKRLYSKRSGFTLVEIVIAFAVFAIMATMLVRILNLTINRKSENANYEKYLQDQEKTLVGNGQKWNAYDDTEAIDGSIDLILKDKNGNQVADPSLQYQIINVNGEHDAGGINYFVGDIEYAEGGEGVIGGGAGNPGGGGEAKDPSEVGGSSQMSRFDTRLTGTKGIQKVTIIAKPTTDARDEFDITVYVYDSGVGSIIKNHSQVTLFFGEGVSGGKAATVVSVKDKASNRSDYKYTKVCGTSGVNVHCTADNQGFNSRKVEFTVKFSAPIANLGFGDNGVGDLESDGGCTYAIYKGYVNILGAYDKTS